MHRNRSRLLLNGGEIANGEPKAVSETVGGVEEVPTRQYSSEGLKSLPLPLGDMVRKKLFRSRFLKGTFNPFPCFNVPSCWITSSR